LRTAGAGGTALRVSETGGEFLQLSAIIDLAKSLLPSVIVALIGMLLLRRLEGIKSEVSRRSDFNQKWADLFFDASNALMVSVEHIMTYAFLLVSDKNENSPKRIEWQQQMNEALNVLVENGYRIDRLSALAASKGPAAKKAADDLFESVKELFNTKRVNLGELRDKINTFNRTVREAHSEMIASRKIA
jgi:hypothetical protein